MGQHFFFDIGNGDSLAFFWFPGRAGGPAGDLQPAALPGQGSMITAHGSMNHIAFNVPPEKFDDYVERLRAKGVAVAPVLNHDDSRAPGAARGARRRVRALVYFFDPDGVCLEFAGWTKDFTQPMSRTIR